MFSNNRDWLMSGNIDERLFEAIKKQAYARQLLSLDHFSVDGTLLDACASLKSFRPRDNSDDDDGGNFHGHKRRNETQRSNTDPGAKRYRKGLGKEVKLCFMGPVLTENRHGLIVEASLTEAGTKQEWLAGVDMLSNQPIRPGQTVGADKGYDLGAFVAVCRERGFTPYVERLDGVKTSKKSKDRVPMSIVRTRTERSCRSSYLQNRPMSGGSRRPLPSNPLNRAWWQARQFRWSIESLS